MRTAATHSLRATLSPAACSEEARRELPHHLGGLAHHRGTEHLPSTTSTRSGATGHRASSTSTTIGDVVRDRRHASGPWPVGLVAAAGKPREEIRMAGVRFEELHRGGWDPDARIEDQDRDGVAAEVIYPTVGMVLCNHKDFDYKKACFDAYNRWIAEYCAAPPGAPARLRPDRDAHARGGHRGPEGDPGARAARRHDARATRPWRTTTRPSTTAFWEAAIELGLPLSFHILTDRNYAFGARVRGPAMNGFLHDRARLPGHHGDARPRRRVRAPPGAARSSASRPTPAGCPTTCTGWTTPTSATATGSRPARSSRSSRRSTSARTSTRPSRTTGWRSRSPTS